MVKFVYFPSNLTTCEQISRIQGIWRRTAIDQLWLFFIKFNQFLNKWPNLNEWAQFLSIFDLTMEVSSVLINLFRIIYFNKILQNLLFLMTFEQISLIWAHLHSIKEYLTPRNQYCLFIHLRQEIWLILNKFDFVKDLEQTRQTLTIFVKSNYFLRNLTKKSNLTSFNQLMLRMTKFYQNT